MFPRAVRNASLVVVVCCLCLLQCEAWQAGLRRWRRQTSGQDLGPTEEGTSISRTCAYRVTAGDNAPLVWEVQLAAGKRAVATCVTNQGPYSCTVSSGFSSLVN
ncbi:uncharacterized protein LOC101857285, partial [Aplysia californica]|uniref:Uncharacterized protein LOC101857285 n=1 Tax=Aplysia californica TaxID=6500 RepID=A0ABM1W221_APLCA